MASVTNQTTYNSAAGNETLEVQSNLLSSWRVMSTLLMWANGDACFSQENPADFS